MVQLTRILIITMTAGMMLSLTAFAQQRPAKGNVELACVVEKEVEVLNEDGTKVIRRVKAERVLPGDVVRYTVRYRNIGDEAAENVVINNPIPDSLVFAATEMELANALVEFSVNGGKTFGQPETLKIVEAEGTERAASPADYTHIRWQFTEAVEPGDGGQVTFRTILQ